MAFVEAFRKIADRARTIAALYVRPTTVTIVVNTYDGAVGTDGVSLVSSASTIISPSPKVALVGASGGSAFGGGYGANSAGGLASGSYRIGPITLPYDGGGYLPSTVLPDGDVTKETYVLLSGGAFAGNGERYEVVPGSVEATRAHQFSFTVQRTSQ